MATATLRVSAVLTKQRIASLAVAGICLAYTLSLLIIGSALGNQYGFPLDDSYITQTLARNFAQSGVLGFTPGHASSGATSLLWALIQALNFKVAHLDPVVFNLALGWLLLLATGFLLFSVARRDGFAFSTSFALAATPALCGNFIWLALIGMEHLLFAALVLTCIRLWQDDRLVLVGACAGLLALTRPEAVIFGLFLALVTSWRERRIIPALSILAGWSLGVAILFAADLYLSGSLMPATQQGRSWLWFHENSKHSSFTLVHFLASYLFRLRLQFPLMTDAPVRLSLQMITLFAAFLTGIIWLTRQRKRGINLLLALTAIHFSVFLLAFPAIGHAGRYQPLFLLLLFPGLFFGAATLVRRRAASVLVILAGILSLTMWRIVAVESIGHINGTHARTASWLQQNTPANAVVAAFDIGRISYEGGRTVIDLGGLTDPSYLPYLQSRRTPSYIAAKHADFVILPNGPFASELGFSDMQHLTKVAEFCSPLQPWRISSVFSGNAAQCQEIFRVRPSLEPIQVGTEKT